MDLPAVVQLFVDEYMRNAYKVRPATVRKFDGPKGVVDIELSVNPDGVVIQSVPVLYLAGGGSAITFPLNIGDQGLALFADESLDAYKRKQGPVNDDDDRMNAMADALFLPALGFSALASADNGIVRRKDLQAVVDDFNTIVGNIINWINAAKINGQDAVEVPYSGTTSASDAKSSTNMRAT